MTITLTRPATSDLNWRLRGNCRDEDPDVMHPDEANLWGEQEAKKVCRGCPVAAQCLAESLRLKDWFGVRAGLTGNERRNLDDSGAKRCNRCNDLFVPRLTTQVRCRPCARLADGNRTRGSK